MLSRAIYMGIKVIERRIGWLKLSGRLGTHDEKLATHYLAFVSRYLRLPEPSDTT